MLECDGYGMLGPPTTAKSPGPEVCLRRFYILCVDGESENAKQLRAVNRPAMDAFSALVAIQSDSTGNAQYYGHTDVANLDVRRGSKFSLLETIVELATMEESLI